MLNFIKWKKWDWRDDPVVRLRLQFPAPVWWLTTVKPQFQGSDTLFLLPQASDIQFSDRHAGQTSRNGIVDKYLLL